MTRLEAIHFLIGCMVTRVASRAADEVLPWTEADGRLPSLPEKEPDDSGWDDNGDWEDEDHTKRLMIYKATQPIFEKLAFSKNGHQMIRLTDYLLVLCRLSIDPHFDPACITFSISTSHPMATIKFLDCDGSTIEALHFFDATDQSNCFVNPSFAIDQSATVYGEALSAIAARTDDPFDVDGQQ